ncbi:Fe-S cluster biogenesis protein NfuA, 4Fe-4S-binding domain [Chishuiella changwenlii]|uniref:Fe-S cluster biogenesis protein NfuA, 4Fe-4S-binding domain n=1 Tax=Chishuiella changwenlii TaxID=1434701 RepID=A0A1M6Z2U4_9FLAO|nr:NifU family protein [Chishuiella changwenlii]GGE87347.1 NifU family protein [Chishuiella changwenlii]SHL24841.1 Fe-S cluster biogenesis protein NfuA, 4Fe-4S-binding domain [Chishuiella changwenlii]
MTPEEKYSEVQKALAEIRPFLNSDGGDIELISVEDNIVKVRLTGACTSCSVNQMTLKSGVEMTIKKYVPEIVSVINVSDFETSTEADQLSSYEKEEK